MDFDDTPDEAAFRAEVRAWLDANAPRRLEPELRRSSFGVSALTSVDPVAAAKAWQRAKFEAGWGCPHWPGAYGGRDVTPIQRVIWQQEEHPYDLLSNLFRVGHGIAGPTVLAWGSEAQKAAHLPAMASGEAVWCQLFSEPSAGSDLAALRTRARRDGDGWVVDGHKIWTSEAQHADRGLLLARTDPEAPRHHGLTLFLLDMRAPGVEVRPIKQMNGGVGFNEVFLSGVRVPDAERLGAPGEGWRAAMTTLGNERLAIALRMRTGFPELLAVCRDQPDGALMADAAVRARLADFAVRDLGLRHTVLRWVSGLSKGVTPGPETSLGKLVAASTMQELAAFALELQDQAGILSGAGDARFQPMFLRSAATRIEGGADEILRNIIAERVLGLPRDLRVDDAAVAQADGRDST